MNIASEVQQLTKLFRTSNIALWQNLRSIVADKGFDPETVVVAESFEDDDNSEFGVLAIPGPRIVKYCFHYSESANDIHLVEWEEISINNDDFFSCYEGIKPALAKLRAEGN